MTMISKPIQNLFLLLCMLQTIPSNLFAEAISNPCGGPSGFLTLIDRPGNADSPCAVPFKKAVLETGFQYQELKNNTGQEQNFPQAEFRLGLPGQNELVFLTPNFIHQSIAPHSGFTASTVGIKHEIGYTQKWIGAVETLFNLPTGSANFGSKGLGATLNGVGNYTFNSKWSLAFMFGVTTQTEPSNSGGQRFTSFNPDVLVTYAVTGKLNFYGEVYGQSKTAPNQGSGFNADAGLIYLLLQNIAIDVEGGQRLCGSLLGFEHYVGTGISFLL